jgi:hypothetical protein
MSSAPAHALAPLPGWKQHFFEQERASRIGTFSPERPKYHWPRKALLQHQPKRGHHETSVLDRSHQFDCITANAIRWKRSSQADFFCSTFPGILEVHDILDFFAHTI